MTNLEQSGTGIVMLRVKLFFWLLPLNSRPKFDNLFINAVEPISKSFTEIASERSLLTVAKLIHLEPYLFPRYPTIFISEFLFSSRDENVATTSVPP